MSYFAQQRGGITYPSCAEKCSGFDSRQAQPRFSSRLLLLIIKCIVEIMMNVVA